METAAEYIFKKYEEAANERDALWAILQRVAAEGDLEICACKECNDIAVSDLANWVESELKRLECTK